MNATREIHREAMDLCDLALAARSRGDAEESRRLFLAASRKEEEAASPLAETSDAEPSRSVLYRSAAALALDAEDFERGKALIRKGLSGRAPAQIAAQLVALIERLPADRGDFLRSLRELISVLAADSRSREDEAGLLILFRQSERIAPPEFLDEAGPGYFDFQRAMCLSRLGYERLALDLARRALDRSPGDPAYGLLHLELLRRCDLPRALEEAGRLMDLPEVPGHLQAASVIVLATHLDRASDEEFEREFPRLIEWGRRAAASREIGGVALPFVLANLGLAYLRHGDIDATRGVFAELEATSPEKFRGLTALEGYDERARHLGEQFHQIPQSPGFHSSPPAHSL